METFCPECKSTAFKRNGYTRHGKQNHRCLSCGRQFCLDLTENLLVSDENPQTVEEPITVHEL